MTHYVLIKGFKTYWDAKDYADRLPQKAFAKVSPYSVEREKYLFCIEVHRHYLGGRL